MTVALDLQFSCASSSSCEPRFDDLKSAQSMPTEFGARRVFPPSPWGAVRFGSCFSFLISDLLALTTSQIVRAQMRIMLRCAHPRCALTRRAGPVRGRQRLGGGGKSAVDLCSCSRAVQNTCIGQLFGTRP